MKWFFIPYHLSTNLLKEADAEHFSDTRTHASKTFDVWHYFGKNWTGYRGKVSSVSYFISLHHKPRECVCGYECNPKGTWRRVGESNSLKQTRIFRSLMTTHDISRNRMTGSIANLLVASPLEYLAKCLIK